MDVGKTLAADIVEPAVIFHNVRSDNYGRCAIVTDLLRHVVDIINTLSVHLLYQQVARTAFANVNPFTADPIKALHFAILV